MFENIEIQLVNINSIKIDDNTAIGCGIVYSVIINTSLKPVRNMYSNFSRSKKNRLKMNRTEIKYELF